jgi:hypothetical protein
VVQDVGERRAGDRDAQLAHGGEVRQALLARRMVLREEHLPVRTLQRAPLPNVALQRSQHPVGEAPGVIVLKFPEQRDGHQLRCALEQRHHHALPHVLERIGACAPIAPRRLRGQRDGGTTLDAPRAALADTGLGGCQFLGLVFAVFHVEANLVIGDDGAWHGADLF